jgi:hypothetical protein
MKPRIRYTDEPIGSPRVVRDFLPTPAQLAAREDEIKITIALSRRSVEFFKAEAQRRDTQYQPMIRRLLDAYVDAFDGRGGDGPRASRNKLRAG